MYIRIEVIFWHFLPLLDAKIDISNASTDDNDIRIQQQVEDGGSIPFPKKWMSLSKVC